MRLAYQVVDVFTDRAFAGNPLAVVLGADALRTDQLQRLAQEFHLSETAFPMAATDASATYRLRIFTPEAELPFAGHPSVGSAWVMAATGRIPASGTVVQECGAGLMPLVLGDGGIELTGGEPYAGPDIDPAPILAAVGLHPGDHTGAPVLMCGTGISFAYVEVGADAVERCRPDMSALRAVDLPGDMTAAGISVFSWDGTTARTRVFCPEYGILEDPATGGAALGFGVWLAAAGKVTDGTSGYTVVQGVEIGRPSELRGSVDVEAGRAVRCRITGQVAAVASGEIEVPA